MIARGRLKNGRADLLGQPRRIAPHGKGIRLRVALTIRIFDFGPADIQSKPLHNTWGTFPPASKLRQAISDKKTVPSGPNSTGLSPKHKSGVLPSATANIAAARLVF